MGTNLWLPGSYATPASPQSEVMAEQRQLVEELDRQAGALAYWSHELQTIFNDPDVSVVLAKPTTTVQGLKPGYYHIVRVRPGTAAWIQPYEGPDGEWRDLDGGIVEVALKADLWNDRTQRELRKDRERAEAARKRQKDREAQDRAHEFDERLRSATTTTISVPRSL